MRFSVLTLGCKVNHYESDQIKNQLLASGYHFTKTVTDADLIIINTCSVTHIADRKSRQIIRKTERANTVAKIIVTGCYLENTSAILPNLKNGLYINKKNLSTTLHEMFGINQIPQLQIIKESKNRKYIMVQNGCNYFCSYCIIPHLRRDIYSISPFEIKKQIEQALLGGVSEFVLTGINLGTYLFEEKNLLDLLKFISTIPGNFRIRLSSIEPNLVSPELLGFIDSTPKIASHLHIPLQGSTDTLLKAMSRRYNIKDYLQLIENIKNMKRTVTVTTDIIIGFPTETEADFNATIELLNNGVFMDAHLFGYSPRKGTPAFEIVPVFSAEVKNKRISKALKTTKYTHLRFLKKNIGKTVSVLIEEKKQGVYYGYSENYFKVKLTNGDDSILNSFVNCTITGIFETPKMLVAEGRV